MQRIDPLPVGVSNFIVVVVRQTKSGASNRLGQWLCPQSRLTQALYLFHQCRFREIRNPKRMPQSRICFRQGVDADDVVIASVNSRQMWAAVQTKFADTLRRL